MTKYKILIHDRNYSTFSFVDDDTNEDILPTDENHIMKIDPITNKLFTKDVLIYDTENERIETTFSHVRTGIIIAGILLLENNKTFGRSKNKKRLLYKCIPDDKHLPVFLVPYEIQMKFSKVQKNKHVLFHFDNWEDRHPHGILIETLGDVGNVEVFYEYQLHCKSLHVSLNDFTNRTREQLQKKSQEEFIDQILKNPNYHIEDRRYIENIFTIDPVNSTDFDDAFSIQYIEESNQYKVSIYIANVYFWLETLGLWKSFSSRVSTIYLPDRRRPMLPTVLSDNLCSLQEKEDRFAFCMDIVLDASLKIQTIQYKNVIIQVNRNYRYEEPELIYKMPDYSMLLDITTRLDGSVTDSHDVVSYWMIKMNIECGKYMATRNIGIFRLVQYIHNDFQKGIGHLEENTQRVIKGWSNTVGQYIVYNGTTLEHELMKTKNYVHITSPIRRLVDLLNQIWISKSLNLIEQVSGDSDRFFNDWIYRMDYINISMRSIRKIQTDCELLNRCYRDADIMQQVYDGILFDKVKKNDGSIVFMVYLEKLKLLSRLKTYTEFDNYTSHFFRIFIFEDEYKVQKKIRVQIILENK